MLGLRAWFNGRSIKAQLVILLFSLTAISVVAISSLGVVSVLDSGKQAENITSQAMQKRVEEFLVQTTAATAAKNSILFQKVQHETSNTAHELQEIFDHSGNYSTANWTFSQHVFKLPTTQWANSASEVGSVYIIPTAPITAQFIRNFELTGYLDYIAPQVLKNEPNAVALYYVGPKYGETRYYPNIELAKLTPPDFNAAELEFSAVGNPKNNPERITKWTSVYDDPAGNGLLLTAVHPIYINKNTYNGTIGVDVLLNNVAKNIEDYSPIESSYAFLIDKGGRAVALPAQAYQDILERKPKKGEFGTDLSKVSGEFGAVFGEMRKGKSGFSQVHTKNNDLYVAYAPVEGTSFSLAIAAKQSVLLQVVGDLQKQVQGATFQMVYGRVLPIGIALLVIVWLYGFIYIRRFTQPLKKLTTKTAQIAQGNFDFDPEVITDKNEIGQLTTSFNQMVIDLKASHTKIEAQNKELIHEQARLKASIQSLPFGLAIIDLNNQIAFHNEVLDKLFGRPIPHHVEASGEVLKQIDTDFASVIHILEDIHSCQRNLKAIEKQVQYGPRFFRFFFAPIIDDAGAVNQVIGAVLILEDITEEKAMQRSRDEFFSIASHELRTPLTAIRGNTGMIMDYYSDAIKEPALGEMVKDIHDSSIRLITIVNDFLDMSRLEQGKMVMKAEPFDIGALTKQVLRDFEAAGTHGKVDIGLAPINGVLPLVLADSDRVRQILVNLVSNAVKFTPNGSITVTLAAIDGVMKISVIDTGQGIPLESQHLLFHKFQQASNNILTRDNTRSTGLGLYISKLLAEAMHGKLYLASTNVGNGSTFVLELPITNVKLNPSKPPETQPTQ